MTSPYVRVAFFRDDDDDFEKHNYSHRKFQTEKRVEKE